MSLHLRRPLWSGTQAVAALVGGLSGIAVTVCLRLSVGSPWAVFCRLSVGRSLPPLWLLSLVFVAWFCLVGVTLGLLLSNRRRPPPAAAAIWRGTACLLLSLMLLSLWYALLFGSYSLFLSWLCLPVSAGMAVLCALSWLRTAPAATLLPVGYVLWLLCLFLWQGSAILHH